MSNLGPLHFQPLLKRIRWGGTRLGTELGKSLDGHDDIAESWEIVDHGEDQSVVTSGPLAGWKLCDIVKTHGKELFGKPTHSQFPLLIKFLDANDRLSLQVHPDDRLATTYAPNENGKTEAWVILETTSESKIWLGLKAGVDRGQLADAIERDRLEEVVHTVTPKPGDCFFVPAGTVHAIGEGILLAEVQQSSDLTFRLHDWGRLGTDGQPREIHVQESLDCTDFQRGPLNAVTPTDLSTDQQQVQELVRCSYFGIESHTSAQEVTIDPAGHFRVVMMLTGGGLYRTGEHSGRIRLGETVLIPAETPEVIFSPETKSTWLEIDGTQESHHKSM